MKKAFFLALLLSLYIPAMAEQYDKGWFYFDDGRVCQDCTAIIDSPGHYSSITDKKGNEWLNSEVVQQIKVDHHPYWRSLGQSVATSGQAYGQALNQSANQQMYLNRMAAPRNYNCMSRSYSSGTTTNCMGY